MLDPVMNIAIFVIWWWVALFAMLPIGVRSIEETGTGRPGHDPAAPERPAIWKKALWAAGAALVLWALTAGFIALDPFKVRG